MAVFSHCVLTMNQWLVEPAGLVCNTVNMGTVKGTALRRLTIAHANHSNPASGVSGIHRVVVMETLVGSTSTFEGCVMLPSLLPYLPKEVLLRLRARKHCVMWELS